mmetsp:Transcript_52390/g.131662  ORF Transcript_52390/g.131662 Transcript_52390/m.131662 type:complete len:394 (-) Transcript_52390:2346-3527(-)
MDFINDDKCDVLHIRTALPVAGDSVPFFRGRSHYGALPEGDNVGGYVASELHHALLQLAHKLVVPVLHTFAYQRLQGCNVNSLCFGVCVEHPHERDFCSNRLPAAGWGPEKDILVGVVHCVKYLRLYRVEVREGVETLVALVAEGRHREGREVKQLGVGRVEVRQDDVVEGYGHTAASRQPAVRRGLDVDLRRHGLRHRDCEVQFRGLTLLLFVQQIILAVHNGFPLRVGDPDPPGLHGPVQLVAPCERCHKGDVHPQHAAGYGLQRRLHFQVREEAYNLLDKLAHARVLHKGANFTLIHVEEPFNRRIPVFKMCDDFVGEHVELAQGVVVRPQPPVDTFAQLEQNLGHAKPSARCAQLKQAAQQPRNILHDIRAVGDQAEAVDRRLRHVRLK